MAVATREGANVVYSLADRRVLKALDLMREVLGDQLARRAQLAEALSFSLISWPIGGKR